ncbi:MAG: PatB family C-S lyase [Acidobacteriota bacterium]|nr:PatB family C-S lyase [Acidobacteriota bacterium]
MRAVAFDFDALLDRRGTRSLKWDAAERFYNLSDVIPLWVADMDFPAPPAVVEAIRRRAEHPVYGYPLVPRESWDPVIRWLAERQGWTVHREWLLRLPGVVPSLNLCVRALTRPGDKVVIQTPVYHPFYPAVELNGRRLVRNPLRSGDGGWTMDLDDLRRQVDGRTRLLVLCSPHNPVGRVWTRPELEALASFCRERDLLVVSDEIHSDLVFAGHRQTPFASLGPDAAARTITLQAPSKTFNTAGLGASFAVASDGRLRGLLRREVEDSGLTTGNVFGVPAMEAAYAEGGPWRDELMAYLEGNADFTAAFFRDRLPRLRFLRPQGTYLALVDARGLGLEPEKVFPFFLEKARVYFDDGLKFGEALAGFLRLNLACPRALLEKALARIESAVREV